MFDLIVIGGGPAGVTAALRARELGAQVALVERGEMGGTCTNDGCVPTRVLAHAARLRRDARQYADYGLVGSEPEVDFPRLMARTRAVVGEVQAKKHLLEHLGAAGVALHVGEGDARFLDPHTIQVGDEGGGPRLEGKQVLICAGGHARQLPIPGAELALSHSDVWEMRTLPRSVVVVGGGATGCQLADVFHSFGSEVTVLEMAPRLLLTEDGDVAALIQAQFKARGIGVIVGSGGLARIEAEGAARRVWYKTGQGDEEASLLADAVIVSVGWPGNVQRLNLQAAGVEVERDFIKVNDALQSSVPHIYAAGDITGRMMLVQSAQAEARVATENALLGQQHGIVHRIVPHGGFTDPEYAGVGMTEEAARAAYDVVVASVPYTDLDRAVIDGHPVGFCKLIVSRESQTIVGAHVVGEQAVEVVQILAAGMAAQLDIEQLANLELAYPTFTAIAGLTARKLVRELGIVPLAPGWRTLQRLGGTDWERSAESHPR